MVVHGWTLLFHEAILGQLTTLAAADARARKADPTRYRANANVKVFAVLAKLILDVIPRIHQHDPWEFKTFGPMNSRHDHRC